MGLIASNKGGGNFELVPEDQHIARCVRVIDIGTQDSPYGPKRKVIICWELPECQQVFDKEKGEEPSMLSNFYTLSLNEEAKLRKDLQAWRGRSFSEQELEGFDLRNLIGVPCLLQVIHKTNTQKQVKAVINVVGKLPKGMACPKQILESLVFTLEESSEHDFNAIPEWQRKLIECSAEWPAFVKRIDDRISAEQGPAADAAGDYTFASDADPSDELPF